MPKFRVEAKETRTHVWFEVEALDAESAMEMVLAGDAGESSVDMFDSIEAHDVEPVESPPLPAPAKRD